MFMNSAVVAVACAIRMRNECTKLPRNSNAEPLQGWILASVAARASRPELPRQGRHLRMRQGKHVATGVVAFNLSPAG